MSQEGEPPRLVRAVRRQADHGNRELVEHALEELPVDVGPQVPGRVDARNRARGIKGFDERQRHRRGRATARAKRLRVAAPHDFVRRLEHTLITRIIPLIELRVIPLVHAPHPQRARVDLAAVRVQLAEAAALRHRAEAALELPEHGVEALPEGGQLCGVLLVGVPFLARLDPARFGTELGQRAAALREALLFERLRRAHRRMIVGRPRSVQPRPSRVGRRHEDADDAHGHARSAGRFVIIDPNPVSIVRRAISRRRECSDNLPVQTITSSAESSICGIARGRSDPPCRTVSCST